MALIEYLALPLIPENLIQPLDAVLQLPPRNTWFANPPFSTRACSPELNNWIRTIFTFPLDVQYQLIWAKFPIHRDNGRTVAYNYILEQGGTDVRTTMYNDSNEVLHTEIIPLHKWHKIDVTFLHGVNVVPDKIRLAISVTPSSALFKREDKIIPYEPNLV